jgi:D-alanyl-lipoteichoic acid acyltransferase DltB (MBOAT superfamily)
MLYGLAIILTIALAKFSEMYLLNIVIIFFLMRMISVFSSFKLNQTINFRHILGYLFFVPALITGPHTSYDKWRNYKFNKKAFLRNVFLIFSYINLIMIVGIVADQIILTENLGHNFFYIYDYLIFLTLYCQFFLASKIVAKVSIICSQPCELNFDKPLLSKSITEFWNRWHMSLGKFIKENIFSQFFYYFLKKRVSPKVAYSFAIFLAFSALGIWHAFTIEYFLFGIYFGVIQIFEKFSFGGIILKDSGNGVNAIKIIYTQIAHIIGFSLVSEAIYKYILILP